eukprot:gene18837-890_t
MIRAFGRIYLTELKMREALVVCGGLVGGSIGWFAHEYFGGKPTPQVVYKTAPALLKGSSKGKKGENVPAITYSYQGTRSDEKLDLFGLPSEERIHYMPGYVSSANYHLREPNWVMEHVTAETVKGEGTRESSNFKSEASVPGPFRSANKDYLHSGMSRGHMAPAQLHKHSQEAMDATFNLSLNIVPQV